ncbi:HesA/MoeB/ThiF family protein [Aquisphaera insulae]|uniref:HesA/MoeB/ThiF family protein n=1 Tax=Aquisphaera insulae TaxID=2712864 RepID=UPI0013ED5F32|nr:HesA/MoeB/ThiF family protein [Aquisphaera insulae]
MILPKLSNEERVRYDRQIGPGVLSEEGQRRLKGSTALVTRVGGLGGPAALSLAMAGVGTIIIAHGGELESPDMNRQLLGSEAGVGMPRADQFARYLRAMSRFVSVEVIDHEPDDEEADILARRVDIILSCPADFEHRLRLNRAAYDAGIPFIDAAQWGMAGSLFVCDGKDSPCLACAYPEEPPFEARFPVVGAIAATMGNLAALEAIKILGRAGIPSWGRLLVVDGFRGEMSQVRLWKRADCPVCGAPPATGAKIMTSSPSTRTLGV